LTVKGTTESDDRPLTHSRWALVLAGGDGTRLQELTREICGTPVPKQYCRGLVGGRSLLALTLDRARHFTAAEQTMVTVKRGRIASR